MDDILKYAIDNGILDLSNLQDKVEMKKREYYLDKHMYSVWEGKDGHWRTYFPDGKGGRIQKKRKSLKDLENDIVEYWKLEEDNPTVEAIYKEWIGNKLAREDITLSTVNRYNTQYNESMKKFGKNRIKSISEYDIETFLLDAIHEHTLTVKGYSNLRTLIYGIFKLAKKKKYIDFSITEVISDMEISKKSFRKIIKSDDELVFTDDEMSKVIEYLSKQERGLVDLGLLLLFKSGLRPGELAGLKKCDIEKNIIHVNRTEIHYTLEKGKKVYEVRDFPKTEAGIRDVIIPDSALWILKRIRQISPFGEYVFELNGKRIKTYVFSNRLKKVCRDLNIQHKSPNKIRKTYGTILIDNNVDESLIISQMGHTNINTTKTYYYKNRKNKTQKAEMINSVANL